MGVFKIIARGLVALGLFYLAYRLLRLGEAAGTGPGGFVALVAMFACVLAAAFVLLPWLLPVAARPFTAMIDGVYGTGPGRGRPPLDYTLARGYVRQFRWDEAIEEYRRLSRHYPREIEPYRELLTLHLRERGDREEAQRVLRRALRKLRSPHETKDLQRHYRELADAGII